MEAGSSIPDTPTSGVRPVRGAHAVVTTSWTPARCAVNRKSVDTAGQSRPEAPQTGHAGCRRLRTLPPSATGPVQISQICTRLAGLPQCGAQNVQLGRGHTAELPHPITAPRIL